MGGSDLISEEVCLRPLYRGYQDLAKLANHFAKKGLAGSDGVCDFGRLHDQQLSIMFATMQI